jgi:glyceraldehyde 3-phosphate dehydrogenase
VVAINDLGPVETNAHLLRFDSVHGRFPADVTVEGEFLVVNGQKIRVTAIKDPATLPHKELGVDIALECTGIFTSKEKASAHLQAGAKRVIVSAPADGADLTVVYGVNHDKLTEGSHGHLERLLHHELPRAGRQGAQRCGGHREGLHDHDPLLHQRSAVARPDAQGPLPRPRGGPEHDPDLHGRGQGRGPRPAELNGKLDGVSIRVPTPNVSVIDFKFVAKRPTTKDEINEAIKRAAEQQLKGVLGYTDQPNVSIDFNHDPHSSVFHMDQTKVMDGTLVRVMSWYDNEWGFSNRMADTAVAMAKLI